MHESFLELCRSARNALGAFMLCIASAGIQAKPLPPAELDRCARSKDERALLTCREQEFSQARGALESVAASLRASYQHDEPKRAAQLDRALSAWKEFRDAQCAVETFDSRGGSALRVYELTCLSRLTREQSDRLRGLVDSP